MSETTPEDTAAAPEAAPEPETLHGAPVTWSCGHRVVHTAPDGYLALVQAIKNDGFELCSDLTAVDYLTNPHRELPDGIAPERFEVVVNLRSLRHRDRIRVRVQVPEETLAVPTLFELYPGTEFMEREVYDMFGIRFEDHPDLVRILMPDDWEGHPLRKDYTVGRIPVQFKATQGSRRPVS